MAKSDYGRDMYRQLTEVMARLEKVEEKSRESEKNYSKKLKIILFLILNLKILVDLLEPIIHRLV